MKILEIVPLPDHRYITKRNPPLTEEYKNMQGSNMNLTEYTPIVGIGLVKDENAYKPAEWKALILNPKGELEVASEREGFVSVYSTFFEMRKRDIQKEKPLSTEEVAKLKDMSDHLRSKGWVTEDTGYWYHPQNPAKYYPGGYTLQFAAELQGYFDSLNNEEKLTDEEYLKSKGWRDVDGAWDHSEQGEGWTLKMAVAKERYSDVLEEADRKVEDDLKT